MPERAPVAVVVSENQRYHYVYCNDGNVLMFDAETRQWVDEELPPLPRSEAAQRVGRMRRST